MIKIVDQTIDYTSVSQMSYVKNWQSPSNNVCSAEKYAKRCTEVRFASFLSGAFITAIVVNSPERKLAKRTSVQLVVHVIDGMDFYENEITKVCRR